MTQMSIIVIVSVISSRIICKKRRTTASQLTRQPFILNGRNRNIGNIDLLGETGGHFNSVMNFINTGDGDNDSTNMCLPFDFFATNQ